MFHAMCACVTYGIFTSVNANLDLIVSATALLRSLNETPGMGVDHSVLNTTKALQEQVTYSMQECAGTERYFSNKSLFDHIVQMAKTIPHTVSMNTLGDFKHDRVLFFVQYFIGGNAALMAEKLVTFIPAADIYLVAPIGPQLKKLLHSQLNIPRESLAVQDEIHVIMEYPSHEVWGQITSSCANRVIHSHDVSNSQLSFLEPFKETILSSRPDLAILSGAHLLEATPRVFWEERIQEIASLLQTVRTTPVHFELATVGDLSFLRALLEGVVVRASSLGLNEQELLSLSKAVGVSLGINVSKPELPMVADLLHWLITSYGSLSGLSRIHLHTLTYHIVAELTEGPWHYGESAVVMGAKVAGLQACSVEKFDGKLFEIRLPSQFYLSHEDMTLSNQMVHISPSSPVVHWLRGGVRYFLSPVLVCKQPLKTVGLGDAISSTGLVYSMYSSKK